LPLKIIASINISVIGKHNNEERAANLNGKALRIKLKVAFKESVYIKRNLFILKGEGFIRGHRLLL
jgi:hypothetical protein